MLAGMRSFLLMIAAINAAVSSDFLMGKEAPPVPGDAPPIPPDIDPEKSDEDLPPPQATLTEIKSGQTEISNNQIEILNRLKRFDNQAKSRQEKITAFIENRTSRDRWSTFRAVTTPLPQIEAFRHEITNQPILPNNSLPAAHDPNDHLSPVANGTSSLQSYRLTSFFSSTTAMNRANASSTRNILADNNAAPDPTTDLPDTSPTTLEIGFQIRPGVFFDTGYAGGKNVAFNPGVIALSRSQASLQNGQVYYDTGNQTGSNGFVFPYRPQFGITSASDIGTARAYADTISNSSGSNVTPRTAVLQYVDPGEEWVVIFGQTETLFGDLGSAPASLMTGALPVGTVSTVDPSTGNSIGFTGVPQFRVGHFWHNRFDSNDMIEVALSAEDPRSISANGILQTNSAQTTILQRYPTFVGRVRYQGSNAFDSYQVAALARPMAMADNVTFHDTTSTGYGFSTNARFELGSNGLIDTLYFGAVGGRGIGGYIFGDIPGAVAQVQQPGSADSLRMLTNVGAYGAYNHVWTVSSNGNYWSSNFMGGLAQSQDPGHFSGPDVTGADGANRNLYQVGCNILWHSGSNSTVGLEYQYGSRLAVPITDTNSVSGPHGEDHRIMLVMQFGLNPSIKQGAPTSATKNATASGNATAQDAANASSSSRISRMRF